MLSKLQGLAQPEGLGKFKTSFLKYAFLDDAAYDRGGR
jgi:hypothetical protein